MAASPPRPSDPKVGGNKQALMDSFAAAKSENPPPNEAPPGTPDDGADGDGPPGAAGPDVDGPDPEVQQIGLKLDHLVNLLMSKGVLQPHDIMSPPQIAPIGAPGTAGPPPGMPPMPPGGPQGGPPPGV